MAATAFAELIALSVKARELHEKSHYERALEKWRAALAVAETLGAEDCVIVAATQTELARSSISVEAAQNGRFSQAFVLEVLDLLAASAATLRRRRNAGTLMEGKCRPNEGRWFVAYLVGKIGSPQEDQQLHALASLVGYDMFLNVCDTCMFLLFPAMQCGSFERSGEPERAFLSFLCDLIDEAVALMVQPRVTKLCTSMEFSILPKWPHWLEAMAQVPGLQAWHDRVSRAYTCARAACSRCAVWSTKHLRDFKLTCTKIGRARSGSARKLPRLAS
jgi:hypothetical protein